MICSCTVAPADTAGQIHCPIHGVAAVDPPLRRPQSPAEWEAIKGRAHSGHWNDDDWAAALESARAERAQLCAEVLDLRRLLGPYSTVEIALSQYERTRVETERLKAEDQDTRNSYTALKHSAGDRIAFLELQFEEARKIIEQVSHSPEFKEHFYDGSWQDPCGVHAFTEKYAEKQP